MSNKITMPVLGATVDYSMAPKVKPRVHAAVLKECNKRVMQEHARLHIPRHFEAGADKRYGYRSRLSTVGLAFIYRNNRAAYDRIPKISKNRLDSKTGNVSLFQTAKAMYQDVKNVLGYGPLVWSGALKQQVTNPANQVVRGTQYGSSLTIKTPVYATSRIKLKSGKRATQMQKEALRRAAELQAITEGEQRTLRAIFRREYLKIMSNPNDPAHTFLGTSVGDALRQRAARKKKG